MGEMRIRGVTASLIVCASLGAAGADTPQQQADKLFAEGRELLTVKKDAKGACEKFEAAIKIDPTATGTMLNLGLCYETLGKYASSIRWFRKAQAAASENKLTEYETAAKQHTLAIAPKVPTVKLDVSVPEAEVRIDGLKVDPTDYGRFEVDPGEHAVLGRAPGKKQVVTPISLKDAENQVVTLAFTEKAVPVYVDRGRGRKRGALILGGAGVVALGFVGIYGKLKKDEYEDPTNTDYDTARKELRYIGTSVFVVGAGALAAGAILYFTAPGKEQISDGTAFAPMIGSDKFGLAVSGSF